MTTITLEKYSDILDKNVFIDVYDLATHIVNNVDDFGLKKLASSEIGRSLSTKAKMCKNKSTSEFINI